MNEHDEAFLERFLTQVMLSPESREHGSLDWTADDILERLRQESIMALVRLASPGERRQRAEEVETWKRILDDPILPMTLVRIEDAVLYE